MGSRNLDGAKSYLRAQSRMIGISRATRAVLLMKPPATKTSEQKRMRATFSEEPVPRHSLAAREINPARSAPCTTTKSAATVTRAGLLKPLIASVELMTPRFQTTARAASRMMKGGKVSWKRQMSMSTMVRSTAQACHSGAEEGSCRPWRRCRAPPLPERCCSGSQPSGAGVVWTMERFLLEEVVAACAVVLGAAVVDAVWWWCPDTGAATAVPLDAFSFCP
mmetsp:Transcript_72056/g.211109  ORF Transcript_72056/g.211109 Transcript_72056/m.211109 type:complete len:222 (+) Transcript_72056:183-848(+)